MINVTRQLLTDKSTKFIVSIYPLISSSNKKHTTDTHNALKIGTNGLPEELQHYQIGFATPAAQNMWATCRVRVNFELIFLQQLEHVSEKYVHVR